MKGTYQKQGTKENTRHVADQGAQQGKSKEDKGISETGGGVVHAKRGKGLGGVPRSEGGCGISDSEVSGIGAKGYENVQETRDRVRGRARHARRELQGQRMC